MISQIEKAKDNTLDLKITIKWDELEKIRTEVENEMVKNISMPGFRKGNAPQKIAKNAIDKEKLKEEILRRAVPKYYSEAVEKNKIRPIITPFIHIEEFEEGTDLLFTAKTCEEPDVDLKNYKEEIKKHTAKSKIVVPGKEEKKPNLDELIDITLKNTEAAIPHILVERETNRLLSQFIDELKTLGMNLDQYLASKGKTGEELRKEQKEKAENDLKLEFVLRKIADTENIKVDEKDINGVLQTIKDEKQKKDLSKNPYFLASIIRQQKTLDFLSKM